MSAPVEEEYEALLQFMYMAPIGLVQTLADGEITMITRDDGSMQVAYNGWPLYYYEPDNAPGDTTGHEVGGVWFVIAP